MFKSIISIFIAISILSSNLVTATTSTTNREPQFDNNKVNVWKTIIHPGKSKILKMHRHEHDRVLVALSSGTLKITNNKNQTHYLKLEKNKAYYLTKDTLKELHSDQNISKNPIEVMVIEIKD